MSLEIAEYNPSGVRLRIYGHGLGAGDDPMWLYESTQIATGPRFLHKDARGSVVAVTSHTGLIARNSYDAYGIPDSAAGDDIATKGRFRYTGQAWLPELGMYYYKARIYSPTLGRFLQTDPIGYEDQQNLYAYTGNDPVNGVDPSGKCPDCLREQLDEQERVQNMTREERAEYYRSIRSDPKSKLLAVVAPLPVAASFYPPVRA